MILREKQGNIKQDPEYEEKQTPTWNNMKHEKVETNLHSTFPTANLPSRNIIQEYIRNKKKKKQIKKIKKNEAHEQTKKKKNQCPAKNSNIQGREIKGKIKANKRNEIKK